MAKGFDGAKGAGLTTEVWIHVISYGQGVDLGQRADVNESNLLSRHPLTGISLAFRSKVAAS